MSEHTVKIDPETGRMIADLAHFLSRTKKDVVRDAVLVFADLHETSIARGAAHSTERAAAASGSIEGARLLAAAGGDIALLPLRDRLTVLRAELIALIERHGAKNPRLIGELAAGGEAETVELLVDTDLYGELWNHVDALHRAQLLLDAPVEFTDSTGLRLLRPDGLARLEGEAVPL